MTLPASGPISLAQVNSELNWSATRSISFNDPDVRKLARSTSGAISANDLLGNGWFPPPPGVPFLGPTVYFVAGTGNTYWLVDLFFSQVRIYIDGVVVYTDTNPSQTTISVGNRTYYRYNLVVSNPSFNQYAFAYVE